MYSFYIQCLQREGAGSALHQLISTYGCDEEFKNELHAVVNNLDFEYGQMDDLMEQIDILEANTAVPIMQMNTCRTFKAFTT